MLVLLFNLVVSWVFRENSTWDFHSGSTLLIIQHAWKEQGTLGQWHVKVRNIRSVVDVFLLWFKVSLRCSEISFLFQWDKRLDAWWSNGDQHITHNATRDVFWSISRYCAAGWKKHLKTYSDSETGLRLVLTLLEEGLIHIYNRCKKRRMGKMRVEQWI